MIWQRLNGGLPEWGTVTSTENNDAGFDTVVQKLSQSPHFTRKNNEKHVQHQQNIFQLAIWADWEIG